MLVFSCDPGRTAKSSSTDHDLPCGITKAFPCAVHVCLRAYSSQQHAQWGKAGGHLRFWLVEDSFLQGMAGICNVSRSVCCSRWCDLVVSSRDFAPIYLLKVLQGMGFFCSLPFCDRGQSARKKLFRLLCFQLSDAKDPFGTTERM